MTGMGELHEGNATTLNWPFHAVPDPLRAPHPLRTLEEMRADILAVQNEAEGLLDELVQGAAK